MTVVHRRWSLLAAVVVTIIAASASATTMRRASVEELARASDAVVRGRVVSVSAERRAVNGRDGIYTTVRVAVDAWWVGGGAEAVNFVVHGGQVGDDIARVHGQATFTAGERVVVFLFRGGDVLWPTGMCQGKWRIRDGEAWSATDPSAVGGQGGLMSTVPEAMSVTRLRERVRAAAGARR